jgi:hypothetical protein
MQCRNIQSASILTRLAITADENGCPTASVAVAMRSSAEAMRSSAGACSKSAGYLIPAVLYPNRRNAANKMTSTTTTATRMVMSRLIIGAFLFRWRLSWVLRYFPTGVGTCDSRNVNIPTAATTIAITMLVEPCAVFTELTCFDSFVA